MKLIIIWVLKENFDKIVIAGVSILALTGLIKVGFMLTAAYLKVAKVWSVIAKFAGLIKVATLAMATSFKKVALTLGGKFQTMLKGLQMTAILKYAYTIGITNMFFS